MGRYWSKWVKMGQNGSKWLPMAPNCSKCLQSAPNGYKCLRMPSNDSKWLQMAPNGSKLFKIAPYGSIRLLMAPNISKREVGHGLDVFLSKYIMPLATFKWRSRCCDTAWPTGLGVTQAPCPPPSRDIKVTVQIIFLEKCVLLHLHLSVAVMQIKQ